MKLDTLKDLFIEQITDLYDAENQLVEALPKMQKASTSAELANAFSDHLAQTKEQVTRLEQVFQSLGHKAERKTCKAMKGLIDEGSEFLKVDTKNDAVRDAALIASGQRVEHYEMAAYGAARSYAELLGLQSAVQLLQTTLDEEGEADKLLTSIAETVNPQANEMAESHHA